MLVTLSMLNGLAVILASLVADGGRVERAQAAPSPACFCAGPLELCGSCFSCCGDSCAAGCTSALRGGGGDDDFVRAPAPAAPVAGGAMAF